MPPLTEPRLTDVLVTHPFWGARLELNRQVAIPYQWEQLERTGTIDNFRLAAGEAGFRQGFFYSDSDAHKWAEAAANALATGPAEPIRAHLDDLVSTLARAQTDDGYLFTYNQLHFPGVRWKNLLVEHELYTLGHLIEAGVAMVEATGDRSLLDIARSGADLAVRELGEAGPHQTPGHQEIEIALIRLFRATGERAYLDLAARFLDQRGRGWLPGLRLAAQFFSQVQRAKAIDRQRRAAGVEAAEHAMGFDFTENLTSEEPPFLSLRANAEFLSGRYNQQDVPVRAAKVPVGHAVRWGYQATAATLLAQETGDEYLLATLSQAWEHMVTRRMYLTGGIGSLPLLEGFGRDWELHDSFAYCETCAALGSVFWSHQMLLATRQARYADLVEWQLYNAAAVGIALDGRAYLYRNPLRSSGGLERQPWFHTACCPSNVSRTWAALGRYLVAHDGQDVWLGQYVGAEVDLTGLRLEITSELPWGGRVEVAVVADEPTERTLSLRIPSWSGPPRVSVDGQLVPCPQPEEGPVTGQGYSPFRASWLPITRCWEGRTRIELDLPMEVVVHRAHPSVRTHQGMVALSRGPLVYCLESCDNPEAGVPEACLDPAVATEVREAPELLGGVHLVEARDDAGRPLVLVPYYAWANRGPSQMQVWVREHKAQLRDQPNPARRSTDARTDSSSSSAR